MSKKTKKYSKLSKSHVKNIVKTSMAINISYAHEYQMIQKFCY